MFHTNDPARPEVQINVVIPNVRGGILTVPASVVIGTMEVGDEVRRVLAVYDDAVQPRAVDRVTSTNPDKVAVRLLALRDLPAEPGPITAGVRVGGIEVSYESRFRSDTRRNPNTPRR